MGNDPAAIAATHAEYAANARAKGHAKNIAKLLGAHLSRKAAPIETAVVGSTAMVYERGYVLATAGRGPIQVVGAPPGTLAVGMRIYVQRLPSAGSAVYVYVADAPGAPTPTLTTSGAVAVSAASGGTPGYAGLLTSAGALMSVGSTNPTTGYFLSCYLYLTGLPPSGSVAPLLTLTNSSVPSHQLIVQVNAAGQFGLMGGGTPWPTAAPVYASHVFGPHRVWHLVVQLGQTDIALNGITMPSNGTRIVGLESSALSSGNYSLAVCGAGVPVGSWVSKITLGWSGASGVANFPYPVQTNATTWNDAFVPTTDSAIVNGGALLTGASASGLSVIGRYLVSDTSLGATTLNNSALGGSVRLTLDSNAVVLTSGPY